MKTADKRKQSLYFPAEVLERIEYQARRLDRSMSWVVQYALECGGLNALDDLPDLKRSFSR